MKLTLLPILFTIMVATGALASPIGNKTQRISSRALVSSAKMPLPKCGKKASIKSGQNANDISLQHDISLNSLIRLNGWWDAANAPFAIPKGTKHVCLDLAPKKLPVTQKVFKGAATFYDLSAGTTYCGETKKNTDMVVAVGKWWMNHLGGPSAVCNKHIEITYGGKTVKAQVVDQCCICDDQDLDLSPALFEKFEPQTVGRFGYIKWKFTDYKGHLNYNLNGYTCPL